MQFMQLLDDREDTVGSRIIMRRHYVSIKVTSPSPVRNKQDTTQNIDTETITIGLQGPVIQCNVATVSLPHPAPAWTVRAGPWLTLTSVNRSVI